MKHKKHAKKHILKHTLKVKKFAQIKWSVQKTIWAVVAAIVLLALIGGACYYRIFDRHDSVNDVLNGIGRETLAIRSELNQKKVKTVDEMNVVLKAHTIRIREYELRFRAMPGSEDGFISEIVRLDGQPIKGEMCKAFIRKMAKQKFISDVDFTVHGQAVTDEQSDDVNVRLNGKVLDLSAICGS